MTPNYKTLISTLCDIRIFIIDDPTLSVFQEECAKRYVAHEAFHEATSTQGHSFDEQETTRLIQTQNVPKRNAYLSKKVDISKRALGENIPVS